MPLTSMITVATEFFVGQLLIRYRAGRRGFIVSLIFTSTRFGPRQCLPISSRSLYEATNTFWSRFSVRQFVALIDARCCRTLREPTCNRWV